MDLVVPPFVQKQHCCFWDHCGWISSYEYAPRLLLLLWKFYPTHVFGAHLFWSPSQEKLHIACLTLIFSRRNCRNRPFYLWRSALLFSTECDATFMLFLSIAVCCPGFSLIVTRGKPLQLSGPWSDNAWFNSSREPIRWANEPTDPNSCSVSHLAVKRAKVYAAKIFFKQKRKVIT